MKETLARIQTEIISEGGVTQAGEQRILHEHELSIYVNDRFLRKLTCTKEYLTELVLGNLHTEGLLQNVMKLPEVVFSKQESRADLVLEQVDSSSFGEKDGAFDRTLEKLPKSALDTEAVFRLIGRFEEGMPLHRATRGTHSCILSCDGEIVFAMEDIGRHNALDKAIGYMLINGLPASRCMVYTSGRIPTDMVQKVIAAGIPVLISKAIPTWESVQLAEQYGLTLLIRAWPDHFERVRCCQENENVVN